MLLPDQYHDAIDIREVNHDHRFDGFDESGRMI